MNAQLVVDAGNTFIKWGRCADDAVVEMVSLRPTDEQEWSALLVRWQFGKESLGVVAGSNPESRDRVAEGLRRHGIGVHVLTSHSQLPITTSVKQPEKVGLDRLLNAVAVKSRKPREAPAVLIDAGTAVTVDFLDAAGVFQGGAIMPGLGLMAELLHAHTAALPRMKPDGWKQLASSAVLPGKSTLEAMALGIAGAFQGGIERLAREYVLFATPRPVFFVGGGDAALVETSLLPGECQVWPEMTLEGIRASAENLTTP